MATRKIAEALGLAMVWCEMISYESGRCLTYSSSGDKASCNFMILSRLVAHIAHMIFIRTWFRVGLMFLKSTISHFLVDAHLPASHCMTWSGRHSYLV